MNVHFLSDISRRLRNSDVDPSQPSDRSDIARFNEARTDEERWRVVRDANARSRARRR